MNNERRFAVAEIRTVRPVRHEAGAGDDPRNSPPSLADVIDKLPKRPLTFQR